MADTKTLRAESIQFASKHLAECAKELIEWDETAILRDGRVRELASIVSKWVGDHDSLKVAESIIKHEALLAAQAQPTDDSGPDYGPAWLGAAAARVLAQPEVAARHLREYAALLADLAQAEPVAVVGAVWQPRWIGSEPITQIVARHPEIRIGSKLYTAPQPAAQAQVQPVTERQRQNASFLSFVAWAGGAGYDTAHTYDTERSRWVALNPMTDDLWACWQAAAPTVQPVAAPDGMAEAVRLAHVAVSECPDGQPMASDWMDCAMKACRLLAAAPKGGA